MLIIKSSILDISTDPEGNSDARLRLWKGAQTCTEPLSIENIILLPDVFRSRVVLQSLKVVTMTYVDFISFFDTCWWKD
jgi:hypothetical protein